MGKFRKKPIVIDAVQMTAEMRQNLGPFPDWALPHLKAQKTEKIHNSERVYIPTLEGVMEVKDGDWIIRGVKGEIYPCKPDIFEATYDPVDGENGSAPHTVDEDFAHFLSYSGFGLTETDEIIAKLKKAFEAAW